MLKGRILLVALAVLVLAGLSFGQLIKVPHGTAGVGTVVQASGAATDGDELTYDGVGVVVFNDGTNALIQNSGIFELPDASVGTIGFAVGDRLNENWDVIPETARNDTSEAHCIAIALEASSATTPKVMLVVDQSQEAYQVAYDNTSAGLTLLDGTTVSNVQEAIDALAEASTGLENVSAAATGGDAIDSSTPVELVSLSFTDVSSLVPIMLHFSGYFDDQGSNNGAYMKISITEGASTELEERTIVLMDSYFHQMQEVTITHKIDAPVDASTDYSVYGEAVNAAYDGGQFIAGDFFGWEVSN